MPRTAVTVTSLVANTGQAAPATTAADPTNGHSVAGVPPEELFIIAANTAGTPKNVIVKAGDNPPALSAGQGDLTVQVPATTGVRWIGPLTSARFVQAGADSGQVHVDLESGFTGTVTAVRIPRTA